MQHCKPRSQVCEFVKYNGTNVGEVEELIGSPGKVSRDLLFFYEDGEVDHCFHKGEYIILAPNGDITHEEEDAFNELYEVICG